MEELKPASKGTPDVDLRYDPQGSGMDHSAVFRSVAPGAATSGNLKHKWGSPEDHTRLSAPPSGLKGE